MSGEDEKKAVKLSVPSDDPAKDPRSEYKAGERNIDPKMPNKDEKVVEIVRVQTCL